MGLFDWFSNDDDILETQLSSKYKVKDLCITSTGIKNIPPKEYLPNLLDLAATLEKIFTRIGPFYVTSAFRTTEVQEQLKSEA